MPTESKDLVWVFVPYEAHPECMANAMERSAREAPEEFDRFLDMLCESADDDLDDDSIRHDTPVRK
jgi:CRISPR/Cas system CSM-associated protein Csm2 small subunit